MTKLFNDILLADWVEGKRLDQLDPDLADALGNMAQEYYERTGEKLRLTSTFRTTEEQAELKKRKPDLAAAPGKSNHEKGLAVDVDSSQVKLLEKYGLIDKYGFHRPVLAKGETWHLELKNPPERLERHVEAVAAGKPEGLFDDLLEPRDSLFADILAQPEPQIDHRGLMVPEAEFSKEPLPAAQVKALPEGEVRELQRQGLLDPLTASVQEAQPSSALTGLGRTVKEGGKELLAAGSQAAAVHGGEPLSKEELQAIKQEVLPALKEGLDQMAAGGGYVLGAIPPGAAALHGMEPFSPEEQAQADQVGAELLKGGLKGATMGLYQPERPEDRGLQLAQEAGEFAGAFAPMGKAVQAGQALVQGAVPKALESVAGRVATSAVGGALYGGGESTLEQLSTKDEIQASDAAKQAFADALFFGGVHGGLEGMFKAYPAVKAWLARLHGKGGDAEGLFYRAWQDPRFHEVLEKTKPLPPVEFDLTDPVTGETKRLRVQIPREIMAIAKWRRFFQPAVTETAKIFGDQAKGKREQNGSVTVTSRDGKTIRVQGFETPEPGRLEIRTDRGDIKLAMDEKGWALDRDSMAVLEDTGVISDREAKALEKRLRLLEKEGKFESLEPDSPGGRLDRGKYLEDLQHRDPQTGFERRLRERLEDFRDKSLDATGINRGLEKRNPLEGTVREAEKQLGRKLDLEEIMELRQALLERGWAVSGLQDALSRLQGGGLEVDRLTLSGAGDLVEAIANLAERGQTAKVSTTDPLVAELLGRTNARMELRLAPKGTGLTPEGELAFDPKKGMDPEKAFRLRDQYPEAITVAEGRSEAHIRKLLQDQRIDRVVSPPAGGKAESHAFMDRATGEKAEPVRWEEFQGDLKEFKRLLEERNLRAPYEQFLDEPGYLKLLPEESQPPRKPVKPDFNPEVLGKLERAGEPVKPVAQLAAEGFREPGSEAPRRKEAYAEEGYPKLEKFVETGVPEEDLVHTVMESHARGEGAFAYLDGEDLGKWAEHFTIPQWLAKRYPEGRPVWDAELARMEAVNRYSKELEDALEPVISWRSKASAAEYQKFAALLEKSNGEKELTLADFSQAGLPDDAYRAYRALREAIVRGHERAYGFMAERGLDELEVMRLREGLDRPGFIPRQRRPGTHYIAARGEKGELLHYEEFDLPRGGEKRREAAAAKESEVSQAFPAARIFGGKVEAEGKPGLFESLRQQADLAGVHRQVAGMLRQHLDRQLTRHGAKGYDPGDPIGATIRYLTSLNTEVSRLEAAARFWEALRNLPADKPNQLRAWTKFASHCLDQADVFDRISSKVKGALFYNYLGGVFRMMLVQPTQNFISLWPVLEGHTRWASVKIARKMLQALNPKRQLPPDVIQGLERAGMKGILDPQLSDALGLYAKEGLDAFNLSLARRGLNEIRNTAGWFMKTAERYNRQVSWELGYEVAVKEKGLKRGSQEAYDFADQVVLDSQWLYTRSNRPGVLQGKGLAPAVGSAAYTFRSYPHHLLSLYAHLLHSRGLVKGAKAIAKGLSAAVAIGGIGAFPLYKAFEAAVQKLGGINIRSALKEKLPAWSTLFNYGLVGLCGIDLGGSLALGLPSSLEEGVSLKSLVQDLGGAAVGLALSYGRGAEELRKGNYYRALEDLAPAALRYPLQAYRLGTEGAATRSGKPILDPEGKHLKLTHLEMALKGLGLRTIKESESWRAYEANKRVQEYWTSRKQKALDHYEKTGSWDQIREYRQELLNSGLPAAWKKKYNITVKTIKARATSRKRKHLPLILH